MKLDDARPSATVVILAWNAWESTRACLDSLLSQVGPKDQVVVVDNGSSDATATELATYPSVEIVSNQTNRGVASGSNQAAALARGDVIVFLHNDTVVADGALEELLSPFGDNEVVAVGPRSNSAPKHQVVLDVAYRGDDKNSIAEFAASWRATHRGELRECERLGGFCLAVRAEAFRAVGGFNEEYVIGGSEDDDLSMKLRSRGSRLLVADGSFVHHVGGVTFDLNQVDGSRYQAENRRHFEELWGLTSPEPTCLLSACLIVKDEEQMLASCLESIADLVDEVVVYDTGSKDRTIDIARRAGARVFEGYWDDSFSRARNIALAQARGTWVLSLDADETFLGDPLVLRAMLENQPSDVEAFLVAIENLHGEGNARSVHTAVRLFRRGAATWRHRLHEQVVAADDASRQLRISYLSGARIIHRGYVAEVFEARDKAERNLVLARAALDDNDLSPAYALMNYGRALESAGHSEEAVEALADAAQISAEPITHRLAVKNLIYILGRLGRFDEALHYVDELRRISAFQIAADIAEGNMRIAMGDVEAGLALLARVPPRGRDDDGMEYAVHTLSAVRGEALASLGRYDEAADVVLDAIRAEGVLEADLGELTSWLAAAGRPLAEIAEAMDVGDLMAVLGRVLRLSPEVGDAVLEGIWIKFSDRLEPLAAAGRLAPQLPVARALVWSMRLRARGLNQACPLVAIARNVKGDPVVRILAGAAAFASFGELAVINAVHEARAALDPTALVESTELIARVAPGLLEAQHRDSVAIQETMSVAPARRDDRSRSKSTAPSLMVASRARRGGVNIVGPFESTSVEGHVARRVATALSTNGVAVSTTSYHADGQSGRHTWRHDDGGDFPFDTSLFLTTPEDLTNFVIDHGASAFEGRYTIGMWLWDFERPSELMTTAARMVHEIWTPSAFSADAIRLATDRPILRMRLPVGFDATDRSDVLKGDAFTFLTSVDFNTGFERQNPLAVVAAFCHAFDADDGKHLVIETAHANRYPSEYATLVAAVAQRSDIVVLDGVEDVFGGTLESQSYDRSCYVSLCRSEGTGLALTRAMSLAIPVIATSHSLAAELLDERDSFPIRSSLVPIPAHERRCTAGGRWAQPEIDEVIQAMRQVAQDPTLVALKARRAQARARSLFAPSQWAQVARERLSTIDHLRYANTGPVPLARPAPRLTQVDRCTPSTLGWDGP